MVLDGPRLRFGADDTNKDVPDDSDDEDRTFTAEDRKKLNGEARNYRLKAREATRENAQLKQEIAQLKGQLTENGNSTGPRVDVILALVKAGMLSDRLDVASKLIPWGEVDDPDEAVEDLKDAHPFLFESSGKGLPEQELPGQGSPQNRNKNRGGPPSQADLFNKYSALRTRGDVW